MSALSLTAKSLLKPEAYLHRPQEIKLIQTQMSFLFLTGDYVYKVKKTVNLGYLDYTSLEKRRYFCYREVELNKRLCPDAYLAVVPITMSLRGASEPKPRVKRRGRSNLLCVEGEGKVVEYAVKMRQLPQERMMDVLLLKGQVTKEMVAKVAEKLAGFHQKTKTGSEIAAFGKLDTIRQNCDENFSQTAKYIGLSIPARKYEQLKSYTNDFIKGNSSLFDKRLSTGRIRDCHGDLHAAHICFTDDICIYDCIEFNDRFRYCDVASEVAFLAMDLDRYQRADLSKHFVTTYVELSHDEELLSLLNFYKCYRAYVRGKVESFKLDDPYIPEDAKGTILATAQGYFELAESYILNREVIN